jgi:hypothetical protein
VKFAYAFVAAILGLFPGAAVLLIFLEIAMFYHICHSRKAPVLGEGLALAGALIGVAFVLKGVAQFLHVIPILGQMAISFVAFVVVLGLGFIFENYAEKRAGR